MKVVPKEKETYSDGWRPLKEQEQQRQNAKVDMMREDSRRHMEVDAGKEDTEEADTLLKEAKHSGTTKTWTNQSLSGLGFIAIDNPQK